MRLSEKIRSQLESKWAANAKDKHTVLCLDLLNEAAGLLDTYYTQCKAATKAERLGLAKMFIKQAIKEDT